MIEGQSCGRVARHVWMYQSPKSIARSIRRPKAGHPVIAPCSSESGSSGRTVVGCSLCDIHIYEVFLHVRGETWLFSP